MLQIGRRPETSPAPAVTHSVWRHPSAAELPHEGEVTSVQLGGSHVMAARIEGTYYAYVDRCPACEASLVSSTLRRLGADLRELRGPIRRAAGRTGGRRIRSPPRSLAVARRRFWDPRRPTGGGVIVVPDRDCGASSPRPTRTRGPTSCRPARRRRPQGSRARCAEPLSSTSTRTSSTSTRATCCARAGPAICCLPVKAQAGATTARCPIGTSSSRTLP